MDGQTSARVVLNEGEMTYEIRCGDTLMRRFSWGPSGYLLADHWLRAQGFTSTDGGDTWVRA